MQPLLSPTDTTSCKWYLNIFELPLSNFEECLINNNLSALIISGFPDPKELNTTWENIMQEYSEMLGNSEYGMYVALFKEVEVLKIKYETVLFLIKALRTYQSRIFCDELNTFLFTDCKFNFADTKSYNAELDKCERQSGAKKIQLDLKLIEFEEIKKKVVGSDDGKIDKNYFTSVLIILSKHNNYRITKSIFVNEYCEYLNQFTQYSEALNKTGK